MALHKRLLGKALKLVLIKREVYVGQSLSLAQIHYLHDLKRIIFNHKVTGIYPLSFQIKLAENRRCFTQSKKVKLVRYGQNFLTLVEELNCMDPVGHHG